MRNLNIPLHTENEPRVENGTTTERKKTWNEEEDAEPREFQPNEIMLCDAQRRRNFLMLFYAWLPQYYSR